VLAIATVQFLEQIDLRRRETRLELSGRLRLRVDPVPDDAFRRDRDHILRTLDRPRRQGFHRFLRTRAAAAPL
jgi:hypothetical protein